MFVPSLFAASAAGWQLMDLRPTPGLISPPAFPAAKPGAVRALWAPLRTHAGEADQGMLALKFCPIVIFISNLEPITGPMLCQYVG